MAIRPRSSSVMLFALLLVLMSGSICLMSIHETPSHQNAIVETKNIFDSNLSEHLQKRKKENLFVHLTPEMRRVQDEISIETTTKPFHHKLQKDSLPRSSIEMLRAAYGSTKQLVQVEEYDDDTSEDKTILLFPKNDSLMCWEQDDPTCRMLQFHLKSSDTVKVFVSAEMRIWKGNNTLPKDLQVVTNGSCVWNWTVKDTERWLTYETTENLFSQLDDSVLSVEMKGSSDIELGYREVLLAIKVKENKSRVYHRSRRSMDCTEGSKGCCRQKLEITAEKLQWDERVVVPETFNVYFCRGRCFKDPNSYAYGYSSILQRYAEVNHTAAMQLNYSTCCAPTSMRSMELIYVYDNGPIIIEEIQNMIVESCGCV